MGYKITKKQCQDSMPKNFVCSNCGGSLEPLDTVDNAGDPTFWSGCGKCCKFDYGVPIDLYKIAKELVENHDYRHYHHIEIKEKDNEETRKYKTECQISGACYLVRDVLNIQKKISA